MSYGLSCIASDIPANREVWLENDRFFKSGDVDAIALKIQEFIQRSLNEEQRKKQINTIAEKYNWEKIAEKTLAVYKDML
jgi:glycosyltransferase involved in cell wall biosynthesis